MTRNDPTHNDCLEAEVYQGRHFIFESSACPDGYSTATNYAVYYLNAGFAVRVQTRHPERILGFTHTVFSGFKLNVGNGH